MIRAMVRRDSDAGTQGEEREDEHEDADGAPAGGETADEGSEWVEIRRSNSMIDAEMARDFLRDNGVRVDLRGQAGAVNLPWSQTTNAIRVVVPPSQVELARETLAAMAVGTSGDQPFRGPLPAPNTELTGADDEPMVAKRSAFVAIMLGLLVPIGAAHFYARHGAAGTILAAGILGAAVAVMAGGSMHYLTAAMILVVVDVVAATVAVRRFNAGAVPSESTQRGWAFAAVVVAFGLAWLRGPS